MADIIEITSRRISGTGQIILAEDEVNYRRYTLYADIIRKPLTPFLDRKYEPPQTFYGYINLMRQGYVLQTLRLSYDAQIWNFDADISGQNIVAIKCEYLGILQSFANLGTALGLTVISVENTIDEYSFLPLQFDSMIIKCNAQCAIQFVLKALPYDFCETRYGLPAFSPPAPDKPTPVLPGVPTEISPPYEGDTITDPAQIDKDFAATRPGTWDITYTLVAGGTAVASYPGIASNTFVLNTPGRGCALSGSSELIRLPDGALLDPAFNCNSVGFVSTITSTSFTPDP